MMRKVADVRRSSLHGTGPAPRLVSLGSPLVAAVDRRLVRLGLYRADARRLVKLQSFLAAWAFVTVALLLVNGAMELWEDGGGRGSLPVEMLGWVVWFIYTLAKVILVGLAAAAVYEWLRRKQ